MLTQFLDFVRANPNLLVLTGAGCSVASGIPTYRDRSGVWQRNRPITHQEFLASVAARKRYWARSFVGWPPVRDARPNAAHRALAAMESAGLVSLLVTQNVDRLHQKAGHSQVIDLHGRLDQVVCLRCEHVSTRGEIQDQLTVLNPQFNESVENRRRAPDGDADVDERAIDSFQIPDCRYCAGVLKPKVVFFGDSVSRDLVACINTQLETSAGLLVVGSSLMVFSGYRFCRHAAGLGIPIACINPGKTRADDLIQLKLQMDCGKALSELVTAVQKTSD